MKASTKTQLMIKQELLRYDDCQQMVTKQDEYLKFSYPGYPTAVALWVSRYGEIRAGRQLSRSKICSTIEWQALKREAKENYKEESDEK